METAIGVFSSHKHAVQAFGELVGRVPQESIVFLSRSEAELETVKSELGSALGGIVGIGGGLAIMLLPIPGMEPVFSLGFGAITSSILGFIGTSIGSKMGKSAPADTPVRKSAADENPFGDAEFFRDVLKEGRSLIVVRTDSQETAKVASSILDHLGMQLRTPTQPKMQAATRHIGDIAILDISGRIILGEGNIMLREMIHRLLESGNKKILLNLQNVGYVDSSGLGELVRTYTTLQKQGGQLILLNPGKGVSDLLEITKLVNIFDIEADEAGALRLLSQIAAKGQV